VHYNTDTSIIRTFELDKTRRYYLKKRIYHEIAREFRVVELVANGNIILFCDDKSYIMNICS
jgi:hypothetical protein